MIDLRLGDCAVILPEYADNSMDAIVTDPPYGLSDHDTDDVMACLAAWLAGEPYTNGHRGFMGATWDSWVPGPEIWRECYRVLKPGGYLLCFAGSRTADLMSIALRLAGFRKHPEVYWVTGQGFPKATNLSKQFDKAAGAEREATGVSSVTGARKSAFAAVRADSASGFYGDAKINYLTAPATPEAQRWDGWYYGLQALKPAAEPVLMFQKPPDRRMTENVLTWGTGAINVDACRVGTTKAIPASPAHARNPNAFLDALAAGKSTSQSAFNPNIGRWPSHLITDGSEEVRACFPEANLKRTPRQGSGKGGIFAPSTGHPAGYGQCDYGDTGSAARFFHAAPFEQEDFEASRLYYCIFPVCLL